MHRYTSFYKDELQSFKLDEFNQGIVFFCSIGVVFLITLSQVFSIVSIVKIQSLLYLLYFSVGILVPVILYRLSGHIHNNGCSAIRQGIIGVNFAFIFLTLFSFSFFKPKSSHMLVLSGILYAVWLLMLAILYIKPVFLNIFISKRCNIFLVGSAVVLPSISIIFILIYYPNFMQMPHWHIKYFAHTLLLASVSILAILFFILKDRQRKALSHTSNKYFRFLTFVFCAIFPLLTFDVYLNFCQFHFGPYIGPAINVLSGKTPLVDVFCQYGLNYLVYTLAYSSSLPHTFKVASAVTNLASIVMYLSFMFLLFKILKNNWLIILGGAMSILSLHHLYPLNSTPSVGAMRFMPAWLLIATLVWFPPKRYSVSLASSISFGIGLLWSIESAMTCILTYFSFLCLHSIKKQNTISVKEIFLHVVHIIIFVTLIFTLLAISIKLYSGIWPRIDIYLELVYTYINPSHYLSKMWSARVENDYLYWAPHVIMLFVVASLGLNKYFFQRYYSNKGNIDNEIVIGSMSVLAFTQFYYFVGKGHAIHLIFVSLPFALLGLYFFDCAITEAGSKHWILKNEKTSLKPRAQAHFRLIVLAPVCVILLSLATALSVTGVISGPSVSWFGGPSPTWLGHMVATKSLDFKIFKNIIDPNADNNLQLAEILDLIKKWVPKQKDILIFHPQVTSLLLWSGKVHRFPISLIETDKLVPKLKNYILTRSNNIKEGDILFIMKDFFSMEPFEQELIRHIATYSNPELIDSTDTMLVYRLHTRNVNSEKYVSIFPSEGQISTNGHLQEKSFTYMNSNYITQCWQIQPKDNTEERNIIFDMKTQRAFDKIWIKACPGHETMFPSNFTIFASNDKQSWQQIRSQLIQPSEIGAGSFEVKLESLMEARWIKVDIQPNPGSSVGQSLELRLQSLMIN